VAVEASTVQGVMRLGRITPEWHRARSALLNPMGHNIAEIYADGMEVGVARNKAAQNALDSKMKYLFFLDWDTIPPQDALCRLMYHLDNHPDYDVAAGLYVSKSKPPWPLLWREWGNGVSWDFTLGEVLLDRVVGVPMGCTLIRVSAFERLPFTPENPWFKTIKGTAEDEGTRAPEYGTEDLWFCLRLENELHSKILMDTGVLCDHIDHTTGIRFTLPDHCLPRHRAAELVAGKKKVLHLGCGPVTAGQLPEPFKTDDWLEVRVDIDRDTKPDVVASITDLRAFGDESAAAVYCSHALEHLHDQEVPRALAEFHRVLKPNGFVVLRVPDLMAVAEAIVKGDLENMAYESPAGPICPADMIFGYRKWVAEGNVHQQHKTGFTEESLRKRLAEAGFESITIQRESWTLCAQAVKPAR
jgi:predicted SAM-dependent methyltransferase